MSTSDQPTEDELRAAYEAEIKKISIDQILLDQVVSLINLGMRRTGLSPGTEDERDLDQVRLAIEAVRALLPLIDQTAPPQAAPVRDALSQLQLAFVRLGGAASRPRLPAALPRAAKVPAAPAPEGSGGRPWGPGGAVRLGARRAARRPRVRPSPMWAGPGNPAPRSAAAVCGCRANKPGVQGAGTAFGPRLSRFARRSARVHARLAPGLRRGSRPAQGGGPLFDVVLANPIAFPELRASPEDLLV